MSREFAVVGIDQYAGGNRRLVGQPQGALILISCEGSEGGGESLITPDQARKFASRLMSMADDLSSEMAGEATPKEVLDRIKTRSGGRVGFKEAVDLVEEGRGER